MSTPLWDLFLSFINFLLLREKSIPKAEDRGIDGIDQNAHHGSQNHDGSWLDQLIDLIASQIDKLIEPITIIILGTMVGLLIYAIYAPVFSLGDALLKK